LQLHVAIASQTDNYRTRPTRWPMCTWPWCTSVSSRLPTGELKLFELLNAIQMCLSGGQSHVRHVRPGCPSCWLGGHKQCAHSALGSLDGFKQANLSFLNYPAPFGREFTWVGPRWVEVGQVAQARWPRPGGPCAPGHSALGSLAGFKQVNLSFLNYPTLFGRDYTWVGPKWVEVGQVAQARWPRSGGLGQVAGGLARWQVA
jgi:hypothetical protein